MRFHVEHLNHLIPVSARLPVRPQFVGQSPFMHLGTGDAGEHGVTTRHFARNPKCRHASASKGFVFTEERLLTCPEPPAVDLMSSEHEYGMSRMAASYTKSLRGWAYQHNTAATANGAHYTAITHWIPHVVHGK